MVKCLAAVVCEKTNALATQPLNGIGAVIDDDLGKIRIDVVLRNIEKIVKILIALIFAKISTFDFIVGQIRHDRFSIVGAVMNDAKSAPGVM